MWADKIDELCNHPSKIVRRNLVYTIRDYLEEFSDDSRGIIPKLWEDGDETVLTRLRELLMRMDEVDADRFATTLRSLDGLDIEGLWGPMRIKNEERVIQWQQWIVGEAEQPITPERPEIHVSDMTEGELPELDDESKRLISLWSDIFPQLPDQLKGRLVPFAPIAAAGDQLVLATETEGLVEAVGEALVSLALEHEQIKGLRVEVATSERRPALRAMLRQMRADRDPVFREKLVLREHETTQAVMDLFGATVDEVGL